MCLSIVTSLMVTFVRRLARPVRGRAGQDKKPPPAAAPQSLEGALVTQLAGHVLNRDQYRRAMEFIAAAETGRNPLSAPSEE